MGELESFLEDLGGEGEAGSFTIDYRAARRNLARYQLESPLACLQNLVMSAVASGASVLRFSVGSEGMVFEHNGEHPEPHQLPNLFTHLFSESEAMRHLAVACNYLTETSAGVVIESEGRGCRFLESEVCDQTSTGVGFRVCSGRDFGYRLRAGDSLSKLASSCRFCPALLYLDGRLLNRPGGSFEAEVASVLRLYDSDEAGDHLVVDPDFGQGRCWTRPAFSQACRQQATVWLEPELPVLHCRAVLGLTMEGRDSRLWFVRHGVRLKPQPIARRPGVFALLSSHGLQLDLSTGGLVENQAYQQRLDWLCEQADRLDYYLRSTYPHIIDRATLLKAARFIY